MLGPGEVEEGHDRRHASRHDLIHDLLIVLKCVRVEPFRAWFDPRPGNGESEELAPELLGEADVFLMAMPEVGRFPSWGKPLRLLPPIPDIGAARIVSLTLMISSRDAKSE
jgi:hypothetical protein